MDRGLRLTSVAAAAIGVVVVVAVVRGVPARVQPAVELLPELLAAPLVLLALRFGRQRALLAALLVVVVHRIGFSDGLLVLAVGVNVVALALVPDLRPTHPAALLHLGLVVAGLAGAAAGWTGTARPGWVAELASTPWPEAILAGALVVAVGAALHRRGPLEASLPWLVAAFGAVWYLDLPAPAVSLILAAAQAILLVGLVEDGRRLAFHDRLTGLPNRRAFDDRLARLRGDFALAMVDVDRFKSFNDRHGHEAGDQVLRMVAAEIARVGGGGRAFRYGGEEFVIVFTDLKAREAASHLETVRAAIADRGFAVRSAVRPRRKPKRPARAGSGRQVRVTVSVGVASPDVRRPAPGDVLRAADKAMYRAKRTGRNRVMSA